MNCYSTVLFSSHTLLSCLKSTNEIITKMQLMMKTKYILISIVNYNKNRCPARMEWTCSGEPYFDSEKSATKYRRFRKLFRNYTGLSNREVQSLFSKHDEISKMSTDQIIGNLEICKNFNVDMCSVKNSIKFLNLNREELKNRLLILKEMGAKYINTVMIHSTASFVPMALFKAYSGISENVSVADIMYSKLRKPPSQVPPLRTLNENMTVHIYRQKCLKHYLRWKLGIDDEQRLHKLTSRLICKPLLNIELCFDVLHGHGKMPLKTILEHHCLVNCSQDELQMILHKIPTVCGVSIVDLLGISPELHEMKYKDVACIKTHLEEYNISSEQLRRFPRVLLARREDFLRGWTILTQKPELRILLKHPDFLRVFRYPKDLAIRLDYLYYLNVFDLTINVLAAPTENFERMVAAGVFRTRLNEACLILCNDLGLNHVRMKEILATHPRSKFSNLYNMYATLSYVQTKFSNSDIVQSLHVILYPVHKVKKLLEKSMHDNALKDASNRYTAPQLLNLCVYEIEREFHFSGDGVWNDKHQRKIPKLSEKSSDDIVDSK